MSEVLIDYIRFWGRIADYYNKALKPEVLEMYAQDTRHVNILELTKAFQQYRRDPENKFMPMPGQLLGFLNPQTSTADEASEAAHRIFGAIRKYGWNNSKDAMAYIGDLGWQVVKLNGGWTEICKSTHDKMIPTLTAQFRDLAKSQITKSKSGSLDMPPSLPEPINDKSEVQKRLSQVTKELP